MLGHISEEQIERTSRIYKSNSDASRALGITSRHYSRLCQKYGIVTPSSRKKQNMQRLAKNSFPSK